MCLARYDVIRSRLRYSNDVLSLSKGKWLLISIFRTKNSTFIRVYNPIYIDNPFNYKKKLWNFYAFQNKEICCENLQFLFWKIKQALLSAAEKTKNPETNKQRSSWKLLNIKHFNNSGLTKRVLILLKNQKIPTDCSKKNSIQRSLSAKIPPGEWESVNIM